MNKLVVDKRVEEKLARGIKLLDKDDIKDSSEDELLSVYAKSGKHLGTAYLSYQNKGRGWYLGPGHVTLDKSYFVAIFQKARQKRSAYEHDSSTSAYRLFNQDGDDFGGLSIDRYNDYALFSWYNSFVYAKRDVIIRAFQEVYPDIVGAYEKIRFKGLDYESAHVYGQEARESFLIRENGVLYDVFLNDGLMTGIFLDQHEVRASLVDGLAANKRLLNMFSYTAAFSVAAAMGGAKETTSVDLAKRSRHLSQAHFQANAIPLENHHFIVMDVFDYFKYAKKKDLVFDIIVLDPPSFARNKKRVFSVAKDYHKLISDALDLLSEDGMIIASTNAANVSQKQFQKQLEKGFGDVEHSYVDVKTLPFDFAVNQADSQSQYLKVFTVKVKK
ncbi:class I SAM-dependent rRNA methyltransferase [Streptococcus sp. zg-JUN1979]|uniref:class I SAM-dependent rRNA methyltransferase n=1 Tax=Streptococcus sp. zg-JUN1979 TaxID=3391450 RepID=UPI0039A4595C